MKFSVIEAQEQLGELVRRAEAGEEVILTLEGHPSVQLTPVRRQKTIEERQAAIDRIQAGAAETALPGPSAEFSQDFLYDANGLPA